MCADCLTAFRVSLLQPTSDKFQDFAEKVKVRAQSDYNYTFSDNEEVSQSVIPNGHIESVSDTKRLLFLLPSLLSMSSVTGELLYRGIL